ncbi:unnamed protein product [Prunus armeniaca]|uniref:Uncharacterized protein n=1 Tax=Prunus armeniaca TaxID=36596 RepID=A0A6J5XC78_PRUAR|nr:unnamed protein product [Prunus armeniaca]
MVSNSQIANEHQIARSIRALHTGEKSAALWGLSSSSLQSGRGKEKKQREKRWRAKGGEQGQRGRETE